MAPTPVRARRRWGPVSTGTPTFSVAVLGPDNRMDVVTAVGKAVFAGVDLETLGAGLPDSFQVIGSLNYPHTAGDPLGPAPFRNWRARLDVSGTSVSLNGGWVPAGSAAFGALAGSELVAPVEVRGGRGVWSTRTVSAATDRNGDQVELSLTTLVWLETPDLVVILTADAGIETLVDIAESLTEASTDRFSLPDR